MATLGSLLFFIRAKNSEFKSKMDESKKKVKEFDGQIDKTKKSLQNWANTAKKTGIALTAVSGIIGTVSLGFAKLASDANEVQSRFNHIFEGMEQEANQWANTFANSFGQVRSEVQGWVAGLQDTFEPMGVATSMAWDMSKALTQLSVDWGSFYNTETGNAMRDIQSAMVGQHETVRKYGIIITETRLKQEAIKQGWMEEGEELTELQKIQARYNLILEGSKKAQGDYLRTQDQFANQLRETRNLAKSIGEEFGQSAVPAFQSLLSVGKNVLEWLRDLSPATKQSTTQIGLLTAGVSGVVGVLMIVLSLLPQLKIGLLSLKASFAPFFVTGVIVAGLIAVLNRLMNIRREMNLIAQDAEKIETKAEAEKALSAVREEKERYIEKRYRQDHGNLPPGMRIRGLYTEADVINEQKYQDLLNQEKALEARLNELETQERLIEEEQKILEEMRKKRSEMIAGDITEEDYKTFLQDQIDAEKWSADVRAQMIMELEALNQDIQSNITDNLKDGLSQREKLLRQYKEDMELLDLEGYKREVKSIQQQMKKEIEDVERAKNEALKKAEEDGLSPDSADYQQIEKDWDKLIKLIEQYWERRTGNVIKKAKDESLAIEKEYQDKIALMGKEGLDRELELLKQKKEAAIKEAKDGVKGIETIGEIDALDEINELYELKEQQIRERYRKEEEQRLKSWNERYILLTKEGLERELEENRIARESALAEAQELAIESNESKLEAQEQFEKEKIEIDKFYDEKEAQIKENYHQKEMQAELRKQQFLLQQREISYYDYLDYIEKQLEAEEKYSDTWYSLMQERQNTLNTIVQNEMKHYQEQSEEMFKDENERITWLINKLMILKERYADNNIIVHLLGEEIKKLRDNIADPPAEDSLNWLENMFVAVGYKAEEAQQNFQDFRDALVDGLTDAIAKGENFLATLKNIADQIAAMIVKRGIVEPFVDWALSGLGIAHSGALVTTAGLVKDLPSYHSGGKIPGLAADERVIKVLTGERILSRNQNKKFEDGEYGKTEIHNHFNINAVDAASFTELVKRNPEAITGVVAGDYQRNGVIRKIIKGGP